MSSEPTISTVIPCYNAAPFLRETIDSVLNQTSPPQEIIVVDDGSTDGSGAIAASYGPQVRVIRQENQGESVARNRGMDEAQSEWIALLDADDRWLPQKLQRQRAALSAGCADVVCVYSDLYLFGSVARRPWSLPPWPEESERRVRMLTNPWIQPGTALIRRSAGQQVRFPEGISHGEDQVFWMRLFRHGTVIHIPEPLIEYRKHPHQQTSQSGHGLRVIVALWDWVKAHPEELTPTEFTLVRKLFAEQVTHRHDNAYWQNDQEGVVRARALYRDLVPGPGPLPPLFERPEPTFAMRGIPYLEQCARHASASASTSSVRLESTLG